MPPSFLCHVIGSLKAGTDRCRSCSTLIVFSSEAASGFSSEGALSRALWLTIEASRIPEDCLSSEACTCESVSVRSKKIRQ